MRGFLLVSPVILVVVLACACGSPSRTGVVWQEVPGEGFVLKVVSGDTAQATIVSKFVAAGKASVQSFFGEPFDTIFSVNVFPDRVSLDEHWRKAWRMPEFRSECWMVASGTATRLDLLSPTRWDEEACEHRSDDTTEIRRVITHELVHVYHGQRNVSPDFSEISGMDWFVEGLASFAAGQHDSSRVASVRKAVANNAVPDSLHRFWTGSLRYALSASVVAFIDQEYGRDRLRQLLPLNSLDQLLRNLGVTEADLLAAWKEYVQREGGR